VAFWAAGLSHSPLIVITVVSGVSVPAASAFGAAALDALAAFGGAGGAVGFAACPHAIAVKNHTQIHSR